MITAMTTRMMIMMMTKMPSAMSNQCHQSSPPTGFPVTAARKKIMMRCQMYTRGGNRDIKMRKNG